MSIIDKHMLGGIDGVDSEILPYMDINTNAKNVTLRDHLLNGKHFRLSGRTRDVLIYLLDHGNYMRRPKFINLVIKQNNTNEARATEALDNSIKHGFVYQVGVNNLQWVKLSPKGEEHYQRKYRLE